MSDTSGDNSWIYKFVTPQNVVVRYRDGEERGQVLREDGTWRTFLPYAVLSDDIAHVRADFTEGVL